MPAELLWSPRALEDLMDIYMTIAADSVDAAERIYTAIEARVRLLPDFPRLGSAQTGDRADGSHAGRGLLPGVVRTPSRYRRWSR